MTRNGMERLPSSVSLVANQLFYLSFSMMLICCCVNSTLIPISIIHTVAKLGYTLALFIAMISFLMSTLRQDQALFAIIILATCTLAYINSGAIYIMMFGIFICGASCKDWRKILRTYIYALGIPTLITIILSMLKLIPTRLMERDVDGVLSTRDSLGFSHPNTLGGFLFGILVAYLILKYAKMAIYDYIAILGVFIILFAVLDSRTFSYAVLLMTLFIIIDKLVKNTQLRNATALFVCVASPIASFLLPLTYGKTEIGYILNSFLSERLRYSNIFITQYSSKPFGQFIDYVGTREAGQLGIQPLILDNSFLHITYSLGYVTLLIVLALYAALFVRYGKERSSQSFLVIGIASFFACAFFEDVLYTVLSNPLPILLFAGNQAEDTQNLLLESKL